MRLYIASGTHVDADLTKRAQNIEENLGIPEHIYFEGDSSAYDADAFRTLLVLYLISPLIAIAATIQVYIFVELLGRIVSELGGKSKGRDREVVDTLKSKYNIGSSDIDLKISEIIIDRKYSIILLNWGLIALIFWINQPINISIRQFIELFEQIAVIGYIIFLIFLGLVQPVRDRHFAQKIREGHMNYENVCGIMGEAHHVGVSRILSENEGVQVINPEPKNPGLTTRSALFIFNFIDRVARRIRD